MEYFAVRRKKIIYTNIQNIRSVQGLKEVHKKYCRVHIKELATAAIYSILQSMDLPREL